MHELYVQIYLVLLHYHRGIRTIGAIDYSSAVTVAISLNALPKL